MVFRIVIFIGGIKWKIKIKTISDSQQQKQCLTGQIIIS